MEIILSATRLSPVRNISQGTPLFFRVAVERLRHRLDGISKQRVNMLGFADPL